MLLNACEGFSTKKGMDERTNAQMHGVILSLLDLLITAKNYKEVRMMKKLPTHISDSS